MHDIDARLLEMFAALDRVCRDKGFQYVVKESTPTKETYLVKTDDVDFSTSLIESANEFVNATADSTSDGVILSFELREDWFRSPTRRHIRRQSSFPQSLGPSKSFGGISGYGSGRKKKKKKGKKKKKLGEDKFDKKLNESLKLADDLLAHDNVTIIPKGSEVEVVDPDPGLPDVKFDGTTINVDRCKLGEAVSKESQPEYRKIFKENIFSQHLDKELSKEL